MASRLPPELLLQIFTVIKNTHYWTEREKVPPCSAVSHVCRQWRAVAIGTSSLWTQLPLMRPPWVETCLSRARSDLEVCARYLGAYDHAERQSLKLIYPELPRISVLVFSTATNYYEYEELLAEVFAGLSSRPASSLRELSISIDDEVDFDRAPIVLPSSLFAAQKLTSLESLSIASCELTSAWSKTLIAHSLQSLELIDALAWRNIDEMVEFFELVPNLQSLDIHTVNVSTHSFDTARSSKYTPRAACLSKLRTFQVFTRFIEDIAIFAYLSFPHTAELAMYVTETDTDLDGDADEDEIIQAICMGMVCLEQHFARAVAAGHGYTHVHLTAEGIRVPCTSPCELHSNGETINNSALQIPDGLSPLDLPFGISKPDPYLHRPGYAMLLEQPIFQTAITVCIQGNLPPEAYSCLSRWSAVEAVELPKFHKSALPGFVAAMLQQPFTLFPKLRRLQLVDATIVEPDEPQDDSTPIAWNKIVTGEGLRGTSARAFIAVVKKLAEYEQFEELIFIRCAVSMRALQEAKEILRAHRVLGDVESPEERVRRREEWKNRELDWNDPRTYMTRRWDDE